MHIEIETVGKAYMANNLMSRLNKHLISYLCRTTSVKVKSMRNIYVNICMYVFSCYLKLNLLIKGTNLAERKLNALNFSFHVLVVQR